MTNNGSKRDEVILSSTDRLILWADTIYDSTSEKLFYVNRKKGLILPGTTEVDPLKKKQAMTNTTFYRRLKAIGKKTRKRMFQVARSFQTDLIDEHDELVKIKKDKLQVMEILRSQGKYSEFNRMGDSVIAMQPFISAYRETIKDDLEENGAELALDEDEASDLSEKKPRQRRTGKGRAVLPEAS